MADIETIEQLLYREFAKGKTPDHPDVRQLKFRGVKVKLSTARRDFRNFKIAIGPAKAAELFPEPIVEEQPSKPEPQNRTGADNIVSAPLADRGQGTEEVIIEKPLTQEEKAAKALKEAEPSGDKGDDKTKKPPAKPPAHQVTKNLAEAAWIRVIPREFTISATIFWAAMEATINYWGWPADMSPEDWLTNFLKMSMEQRGISLGPTLIVQPGDGNGHHEETEPEIDWELRAVEGEYIGPEAIAQLVGTEE
jgi:hypothetical protein